MEIRDYRKVEPVDPIKKVKNEVKKPKENVYKPTINSETGKGETIDYRA